MPTRHVLYECGICSCYHPWDFTGDCRDYSNRFGSPEEYAGVKHVSIYAVDVRSMDERLAADMKGA